MARGRRRALRGARRMPGGTASVGKVLLALQAADVVARRMSVIVEGGARAVSTGGLQARRPAPPGSGAIVVKAVAHRWPRPHGFQARQ